MKTVIFLLIQGISVRILPYIKTGADLFIKMLR